MSFTSIHQYQQIFSIFSETNSNEQIFKELKRANLQSKQEKNIKLAKLKRVWNDPKLIIPSLFQHMNLGENLK